MEISQPEQAFNHSDATFTAISSPPSVSIQVSYLDSLAASR
jgi:hypothetical protein